LTTLRRGTCSRVATCAGVSNFGIVRSSRNTLGTTQTLWKLTPHVQRRASCTDKLRLRSDLARRPAPQAEGRHRSAQSSPTDRSLPTHDSGRPQPSESVEQMPERRGRPEKQGKTSPVNGRSCGMVAKTRPL
jgi:hypothetical protein